MSLYYSTLYWHNWLVFTFGDRKPSDTLDDLVDILFKKADEICGSGGNAATFLADFPGLSRTQREVSACMGSQKYLRRELESEKQYLAAIERSYFTLRHAGEWADNSQNAIDASRTEVRGTQCISSKVLDRYNYKLATAVIG